MDEIFGSQSSQLGEDQLTELEAKVKVANTSRATEWGVRRFEEWCTKRNRSVDLKIIDVVDLNDVLRQFYAELKTKKGESLSPSALTGIRAALHRHITAAPISRSINVVADTAFTTANVMFDAKVKLYRKIGNARPSHKSAIEKGDMQKLHAYFSQGLTDERWVNLGTCQEFVWFSQCFSFGRRGREGWRELHKLSFEVKIDDVGWRYVCLKETKETKNKV